MVKDTSEYRCLQSQFSVLYNESLTLKGQLDETRARLNTTRTARLRQLEHMEVKMLWLCCCCCCFFPVLQPDVLISSLAVRRTTRWRCRGRFAQRCFSWRTRWLRLGRSTRCCASSLSKPLLPTSKQVNDVYALIAFSLPLNGLIFPSIHFACFLFSGPINREMRHLISTLQTHNQQMKGEVVKYKIRLRETQTELSQVNLIGRRLIRTRTTPTH